MMRCLLKVCFVSCPFLLVFCVIYPLVSLYLYQQDGVRLMPYDTSYLF